MAAKKTTGKAVAKWDEELARRAEAAKKMEENSLGTGNTISTRGGVLTYHDNPVPGNKLNAIILGAVFLNTYYLDGYDPDSPASPACYAIGTKEAGLGPHEKASDKQNDVCKGCPQLEWGTSDKGRGKACKQKRRLVLIPEDALKSGIAEAQVASLIVPVTSVKAYAGFTTDVSETLKRPPLGVVTEISLVPDAKNQFAMKFKVVREVPDELIGELLEKADSSEAQAALNATFAEQTEQPARGGRNAAAKARGKGRR